MTLMTCLRAGLIGSAAILASFLAVPPPSATAQSLRVVEGATSASLRVPMNRAVVVESDMLFAELSIANPAIADIATLSERSIYILGRTPGRTTMTLLGADGSLIANVEVQVVPDVAELRERYREILPGEDIEVRTAGAGIVLSGTVSSGRVVTRAMELAERYATGGVSNLMVVGGSQQVMLQVRFAEMQRDVRQALSASLTGVNIGGFGGGEAGGAGGSISLSNGAGIDQGTLPASLDGRTGAVAFTFGSGSLQIGLLIEALESNGMVRSLAEPNLTAISGGSATFLAGGEFPIPVLSDDGNGVEFKPFGVSLNFSPTIIDDNIINLVLDAEISSIGGVIEGTTLPSLNTRSASTTVELRDGDSFAIAGLLQDDFRNSVAQVPWLGDVPILGTLFRSASYQRAQSELVILVTAHVVSPVRGDALALPTDRVAIPTESELFFLGRTTGRPQAGTAAGEVAQQDFSGSYGYVME